MTLFGLHLLACTQPPTDEIVQTTSISLPEAPTVEDLLGDVQYLASNGGLPVDHVLPQLREATFFFNLTVWNGTSPDMSFVDPVLIRGGCHGGTCGGDGHPNLLSYFLYLDCLDNIPGASLGISFGLPDYVDFADANHKYSIPSTQTFWTESGVGISHVSTLWGYVPQNEGHPDDGYTEVAGTFAVSLEVPSNRTDAAPLAGIGLLTGLTVVDGDDNRTHAIETSALIDNPDTPGSLLQSCPDTSEACETSFEFAENEPKNVIVFPLSFHVNEDSYAVCDQ